MIRKIPIRDLQPGMFVVDLHKHWLEHNIWRKRFMVRDAAHVAHLVDEGIHEVSIDTERGLDIPPSPIQRINAVEQKIRSLADIKAEMPRLVSLGEERRRAARLIKEANALVTDCVLSPRLPTLTIVTDHCYQNRCPVRSN